MSDVPNLLKSHTREWRWSPEEKVIARRVFRSALDKDLKAVLAEAKSRVAEMTEPSDLWEMEDWLAKRRQEIDRTFDFRYSVLPYVFAELLRSGKITHEELQGLHQDKVDAILYMKGS